MIRFGICIRSDIPSDSSILMFMRKTKFLRIIIFSYIGVHIRQVGNPFQHDQSLRQSHNTIVFQCLVKLCCLQKSARISSLILTFFFFVEVFWIPQYYYEYKNVGIPRYVQGTRHTKAYQGSKIIISPYSYSSLTSFKFIFLFVGLVDLLMSTEIVYLILLAVTVSTPKYKYAKWSFQHGIVSQQIFDCQSLFFKSTQCIFYR